MIQADNISTEDLEAACAFYDEVVTPLSEGKEPEVYKGVKMLGPTRPKTNAEYYLSYYNDFLTKERFAEYYGMTLEKALFVIEQGRIDHEYCAALWRVSRVAANPHLYP